MYRSFSQNNHLLWAFLLVLGLAVGVQAQSFVDTAHVVDSAGGALESASYSNTSAIGQSFGFDENSSASYVNQGGFLNGADLLAFHPSQHREDVCRVFECSADRRNLPIVAGDRRFRD
jgi:hypothetical protein